MNKKFPCEECREQKRKCDCKQPCDRCERFNLKCIYVKAVSPRDQEYVELAKREEMRCEIKALTKQTEMLEQELQNLHSVMRVHHQQSPPMSTKDDMLHINKGRGTGATTTVISPSLIPVSPIDLMMTAATPPDSSSDNNSIITTTVYDHHHQHNNNNYESNKRRRVIAKEGDLSVALKRYDKHKPWTLTVKNGQMAIETFINSHNDLMTRMWDMTGTLRVQDNVPFSFSSFSTFGTLVKMFNTMMLNKYGKTYCRSMVNAMRISSLLAPSSSSSTSTTSTSSSTNTTNSILSSSSSPLSTPLALKSSSTPSSAQQTSLSFQSSLAVQEIESLTLPLLEAYFRCRHFHHLALHTPTFMRLFVTSYSNISTSPVAMALCAAICISESASCQHIIKIIPSDQIVVQGKVYYDRARHLISDRFDDVCLETFATYVFLTSYKLYTGAATASTMSSDQDESNRIGQRYYSNIAERLIHLLEPNFIKITSLHQQQQPLVEESILFHRLKNYLQRLLTYELAFEFKAKDKDMRETGYVQFYEASHSNHELEWFISEDDSKEQREFIEMQKALQQLRQAIFENSRASGILSQDLTVLTETVIQQQVQQTTAHWYMHILPDKLKLPLPVLEATSTTDSHYFSTLQEQCETKGIVPVLTALGLYDEIILIVQSFLHKRIPNPATNWYFLDQYWQGGKITIRQHEHPAGDKWIRRITKLLSVKDAIEYKGTDDEFFSMVKEVMFPTQPVRTSVIQIGIQVAINMVRLLRFVQNSDLWSCFFDMRFLTDVWVVMFRILRFEDYLDATDRRWLPVLRTNMDYCLSMAREQLGNNHDIKIYVEGLDQDFQDYYVSSCYAG
ncbi:hypothetical protein BDA99DRAFT_562865 [Phascolomyces articulosus]|uniref:Zn(2)-C6 fungal-type domain-containing protein n=1 Tax=Phascolomyces articulosus TaxID=60185 RepID=A0AAD5K3S2_9FUNG|nr:hypothetical protein BDA99DRAFT_562865 [Phascolomyces articulosus]